MKDEGSLFRGLYVLGGVTDKLVGIRCHKGGALYVHIKEDTVHGRADFIICGGVNGALDALHKAFCRELHSDGVITGRLDFRIIRCREIRQGGVTAAPAALKGTVVYSFDGKRLVRKLLQEVYHVTGGHCDGAVFLCALRLYACAEREF